MKINKIAVFFLFAVLITSCVHEDYGRHYCKYDIKIQYDQNHDTINNNSGRRRLAKDRLNVFFESRFSKDRITLYVNNKVVFDDTITTNYSDVLAKYIKLGKLSEIYSVGIRVNNGNLAFAELGRKNVNNILAVDFVDKVLTMRFTQKEHIYR